MQQSALFYLWGKWNKQQAFYIIQLWLHSDSQRWAVDYSGGGSDSIPLFSPCVRPMPVDPLPPLAEPRWRPGSGRRFRRCSEAFLLLRGYAEFIGFFLRFHSWTLFDQNKLTKGMLASYTGDILVLPIGRGRHDGLQDQSGHLYNWERRRGRLYAVRQNKGTFLKSENDSIVISLDRHIKL